MASPVLWQNESQTIILIDIPRSIEAAQGTPEAPCHDHLLSVTPLETPFPSNEPKSEAARAKLVGNSTDQQLDREYVELLRKALAETHEAYHGRWCLPRPFVQEKPRVAKKRKLDTDEPSNSVQPTPAQVEVPEDLLPTLAEADYSPDSPNYKITLHPIQGSPEHDTTSTTQYLTNHAPHPTTLNLSTPTHPRQPYTFDIPPHSTFSLTNCRNSIPFRNSLRAQASLEDTPRRTFDVILLDPPWPNRSIKRTHRIPGGSNYSVPPNLETLADLLYSMDLEMLMSPSSCTTGVWITNKPSIREAVLDPEGGLFAMWGVELVEEWIWVKTTAGGEPVSPLRGVWRRPYEVLLVGRRGGMAGTGGGTGCAESYSQEGVGGDDGEGGVKKVKRRVILGVPDLHSRKPCLKGLVEEILLRDYPHHNDDEGKTGYRALEVFARNLVAGWWSWGDECVKFNWEGYWQKRGNNGVRDQAGENG